jgi:hypothetical protein
MSEGEVGSGMYVGDIALFSGLLFNLVILYYAMNSISC